MVIPDVNLLLYAHVSGFRQHRPAKKWWEALLAGRQEVGIASPALFGFVRLATNRRGFSRRHQCLNDGFRWMLVGTAGEQRRLPGIEREVQSVCMSQVSPGAKVVPMGRLDD